jgi:IS4 transposase
MARSTKSKNRRLHHIVRSPILLRKILLPLEQSVRQSIAVEIEKSWFPKFSVLAHLLCGIFYQIAQLRSMRELVTIGCIKIHKGWLYGFSLKRSTLSDANNSRRRLRVIRDVFANLVTQTEHLPRACRKFVRLAALDSSLLHCVPSSNWASYRKKVNACKAHLLLDLARSIPKKICLSAGRIHDRKYFQNFLEKGWTYLVDRAYNDYKLFDVMNRTQIYFVTRVKKNATIEIRKKCRIKRNHKSKGVLEDFIVKLGSGSTLMETELRLVKFEANTGKIYHFLTNRFDLSPLTIAQLYEARWAIEKFFKWLKRTLSMERNFARSEIGMEIHVLIVLITDILLKILAGIPKKYQHIPVEILRIIREDLFSICSGSLVRKIRTHALDTG